VNLQESLFDANRALNLQATHDQLTELWNRRAIHEFLIQELSRSSRESAPIGVVLADIDHFKLINDTYGHFVGDDVLRQVAGRLKSELRDYDRVGRYGGEEFLLVLPGCSTEDAMRQAERLRGAIQKSPFLVADAKLTVTISAGVAVHGGGRLADVTSLLQCSDLALYRAKHCGRNRVELFTPDLFPEYAESLALTSSAAG
jgi:diguanylate cyclase (GGDEF)-like protein